MNWKNLLADFITKRRESAMLWQVFQDKSRLSRLAQMNFERSLEIRGIPMTDSVITQAKAAAMTDRTLTIGKFLDHKLKKDKASRLSWGKR